MLVNKSQISRSKFSRIGGIYRQDRRAEYKASPPGRAMSPVTTLLTVLKYPPPSVANVSVFLGELNLSF